MVPGSVSHGLQADLILLREQIRRLERWGKPGPGNLLSLGSSDLDSILDGGLPLGRLHEVTSQGLNSETGAIGAGFTACLLSRLWESGQADDKMILWSFIEDDLYAPALAQYGLDLSGMIFVNARKDMEVLAIMEEALRAGCFSAVVGELGALDLTGSRRLQLACENSGSTGFILRRWPYVRKQKIRRDVLGAATRWCVAPIPSAPDHLDLAPLIGRERWQLDLTQKNGRNASWIVETGHAAGHVRVVAQLADHQIGTLSRHSRIPLRKSG